MPIDQSVLFYSGTCPLTTPDPVYLNGGDGCR
jgi:hypothetical protein